jgi:hypothetical protein
MNNKEKSISRNAEPEVPAKQMSVRWIPSDGPQVLEGILMSKSGNNAKIRTSDGLLHDVDIQPGMDLPIFSRVGFRGKMIAFSYPFHLPNKRPNRRDIIDRLSPESTEQMAALFNLDADLSGPMSAIGLAIDACSQNKQNKSILDCEEDLLLSCFLQETKVPKNSNIDRSALLGNNDLQLKLFRLFSSLRMRMLVLSWLSTIWNNSERKLVRVENRD